MKDFCRNSCQLSKFIDDIQCEQRNLKQRLLVLECTMPNGKSLYDNIENLGNHILSVEKDLQKYAEENPKVSDHWIEARLRALEDSKKSLYQLTYLNAKTGEQTDEKIKELEEKLDLAISDIKRQLSNLQLNIRDSKKNLELFIEPLQEQSERHKENIVKILWLEEESKEKIKKLENILEQESQTNKTKFYEYDMRWESGKHSFNHLKHRVTSLEEKLESLTLSHETNSRCFIDSENAFKADIIVIEKTLKFLMKHIVEKDNGDFSVYGFSGGGGAGGGPGKKDNG